MADFIVNMGAKEQISRSAAEPVMRTVLRHQSIIKRKKRPAADMLMSILYAVVRNSTASWASGRHPFNMSPLT
ncbi:hypothetical protein J2T16_001859 [Paenibacillus intestini]|nr:hypothetical protein [Paenibacillus intestini]